MQRQCRFRAVTTPDGCRDISRLAESIWQECYATVLSSDQITYMLSRFQSPEALAADISRGEELYGVYWEGKPAGYFLLVPQPDERRLFLSKLYLQKDHRSLGLSRCIMDFAEGRARMKGLSTLWLTVNKRNPSLAVYRHLGWQSVREQMTDIGHGYVMDDYVMERPVRSVTTAAILVAAGQSTRMGGVNKQYLQLDGVPALAHTLRAFDAAQTVQRLVVVTRPGGTEEARALCRTYPLVKEIDFTEGGDCRAVSVEAGARILGDAADYLAIHDGARPLIRPGTVDGVVYAAWQYGVATAAVPVKDTIKQTDGDGFVTATPDRAGLWQIQTPQVFERRIYEQACQHTADKINTFTDDCQRAEADGKAVYLYKGEYDNLKVTTPEDAVLADALLRARRMKGGA